MSSPESRSRISGEKVTEGLDGLRERLSDYFEMGARFAKWRAVLTIGEGVPSRGCIQANADALARYAALCREAGLVPVVEPEVLKEGRHTLETCRVVTEQVLRCVLQELVAHPNAWLALRTRATVGENHAFRQRPFS